MRVKLIDLCTPKQWKTLQTSELLEEGYPVYGANGIIGYYSEYNHEKSVIAITCRGATCGTINITVPESYVTGNAMCLDNVRSDVLQKYLYYCLQHYDFNNVINGSAQPQITRQGLEKVEIELCSLEEQRRIITILDNVSAEIAGRKRQNQKLEELIKSRFVEMFGDPLSNPMGWKKEAADRHIDLLSGYPFQSEQYVEKGINICGGLIIMPQRIQWNECKHWPSVEGFEEYVLMQGDIVMALDRPWISEGFKIAQVDAEHLPALLIQRTARIRGIDVNQEYLYHCFLNGGFDKHSNITGSLVPHISAKDIRSFEIMLPPMELQNRFASFVAEVDKSKLAVKQSLEKLETLKKSLMQQYFG